MIKFIKELLSSILNIGSENYKNLVYCVTHRNEDRIVVNKLLTDDEFKIFKILANSDVPLTTVSIIRALDVNLPMAYVISLLENLIKMGLANVNIEHRNVDGIDIDYKTYYLLAKLV